ncbi:hypothetical protein BC941DRAFT_346314 [Chlamydoabsidia padenii]|nr:hypothetical protein BC941DRAFT_346314 [Chlamydoabsidia padenii]
MSVKSLDQVIEETIAEALEALEDPYHFRHPIKRVAVVGAGPAGVTAAKNLLKQGFDIQLYERNTKVGGNWVYSEPAQSDLHIPSATEKQEDWLEKDKKATSNDQQVPTFIQSTTPVKCTQDVKHWLHNQHHPSTACYQHLTTNTATSILGSFDFPWPEDSPDFVSHRDVQAYLENYATHFGLDNVTHLNTSLDKVDKKGDRWELTLTEAVMGDGDYVSIKRYQETFDAVVIATGQFQDPVIPLLNGLKEYDALFPGRISHSKQFRKNEDFKDKNVLVVGGRVSAVDVSRFVSIEAKKVYMSYRGPFETKLGILDLIRSVLPDSVVHKPGIDGFWSKDSETGETKVDGTITFKDGSSLTDIDAVVFATGYQMKHSYFGTCRTLATDDGAWYTDSDSPLVVMDKTKIHNTYKDIFLISDPTIAITGAPRHITITPFFEYQAQAIARVWSQNACLPSTPKMASFTLRKTQVCPAYQMDHESEKLRSYTLLPWLNVHAAKLVPDLALPTLKGPSDDLVPIWEKAAKLWPEFIKRQQQEMASKRQATH